MFGVYPRPVAIIIIFIDYSDDIGMSNIFHYVDIAFFHTSRNTEEKVTKKRVIGM